MKQITKNEAMLAQINRTGERFDLVLSPAELHMVTTRQAQALCDTDRVELGESILPQIAQAFCDSPFVQEDAYAQTLCELVALFYTLKSDSLEVWSDEALIKLMARLFNGRAQGSMQALADLADEAVRRSTGRFA